MALCDGQRSLHRKDGSHDIEEAAKIPSVGPCVRDQKLLFNQHYFKVTNHSQQRTHVYHPSALVFHLRLFVDVDAQASTRTYFPRRCVVFQAGGGFFRVMSEGCGISHRFEKADEGGNAHWDSEATVRLSGLSGNNQEGGGPQHSMSSVLYMSTTSHTIDRG